MKCKWEEIDISVGRRFRKPGTQEEWMIGYVASEPSEERRYAMVSLIDGIILVPQTKLELAKRLSDGDYLPSELIVFNFLFDSASNKIEVDTL